MAEKTSAFTGLEAHGAKTNGQQQQLYQLPKAVLLRKRAEDRRVANEKRKKRGDQLNVEGNSCFNQGRYIEAIAKYTEAAKTYGLRSTFSANLASTYLQLEQYELAEWACDCALLHSPRFAEARFCRAMARKGQGMFKGAELDLKFVLKHSPGVTRAREELFQVEEARKIHGDGQRSEPTYDEAFPPFDAEEWDPPLDSDSEDVKHAGNDRPCIFYNHNGCGKRALCEYSHAPDDTSVRDDLGQNVCLEFLLGDCKSADKCVYSHSKEYLPQGWWDTPKQVGEAKMLRAALDDPETDNHHIIETLENTTTYGRMKKYRDYQEDLKLYSAFHPDVLMSRVKDKANKISAEPLPKDPNRFVLILCLDVPDRFDSTHGYLLSALRTETKVVYAKNAAQASAYLEAPELAGVIVGDAGITNQSQLNIASQLVDYVKCGGSVVFAGLFPVFISETVFNHFFPKNFGLQWEYGSYAQSTFHRNTDSEIGKHNPSLIAAYSMKAVHVWGVAPESAIYKANQSPDAEAESFAPPSDCDLNESPAVSARVGRGFVNFLGDVKAEEASTKTILAMLGLLDSPLRLGPIVPEAGGNEKASPSQHFERFILQLSLCSNEASDRFVRPYIRAMCTKVEIEKATTEVRALSFLSSPHLLGVFVTDHALTDRKYKPLLKKLVSYVGNGGCLVFGGIFSSFAKIPHIAPLFAEFDLEWTAGDYNKDTLELNCGLNKIADENAFLPPEIHLVALFLEGVEPHDMVYRQMRSNNTHQTPIAFGQSKGGTVGYIGDVSGDTCTTPILLAMFNLFTYPPLIKPEPRKFVIILVHFDIIDGYEHTPLFKQLKEKQVEIITDDRFSDARLADLLLSPDLLGVFILDDMLLVPKRKWLSHKVTAYLWSGGTVIFCGDFGAMTPPDQFERFVADNFCLPWKMSPMTTLSVKLNKENPFVKQLPEGMRQENASYEGAFVHGVDDDAVVYGSEPGPEAEKLILVPVAYNAVGKGHVAFFGHDEIGESDTKLMLAMLGLVPTPTSSLDDSQLTQPKMKTKIAL